MKKIGIVTWYSSSNYGTCLQAYALYYALKKKKNNVYFLNKRLTIKDVFFKLRSIFFYKFKKKPQVFRKGDHPLKMNKITSFIKEEFKKSPRYFTRRQLKKIQQGTFCFITGSDQIWNPYYLNLHYLLADIDNTSKKIAYSSSIGVDEIPERMIPLYKKNLERFDFLSVREDSANKMLSQFISKEIVTVLDPTFLLGKEDWISFSEKAKLDDLNNTEPFILCYFVGDNSSYWESIRHIQTVSKIKKIVILPLEETHYGGLSEGIIYEFAGPYEFVWLLRYASLVCTDSFHATSLCVNLEKEFIEFLRFNTSDKKSQNSRIYDLLEHYNLSDRFYNEKTIDTLLRTNIDYAKVNEILKRDRKISFEYLEKALK